MPESPIDRAIRRSKYALLLTELAVMVIFLYLLLLFVSADFSAATLMQRFLVYFDFALLLAVLVLMISRIYLSIRLIRHPFYDVLRDARPVDPESPFSKATESLTKELEISPVKLMFSEKISDAAGMGDFPGNILVVFSKSLAENLDLDEFVLILLHELKHLQSDIRDWFYSEIFDRAVLGRLGWMRIVLAALLFTVFFVPVPIVGSSPFATKSPIMIKLTTITYFVGLSIAIAIAITLVMSLKDVLGVQQVVSPSSFYIRELEADAYSLLHSKKPEKLRSAILKSEMIRSGVPLLGEPFDDSKIVDNIVTSSRGTRSLSEMFQVKSLKLKELGQVAFNFFVYGRFDKLESCPISDRILLTKKLELLLKEESTLKVRTGISSSDIKLSLVNPEAGIYVKRHPENLQTFISYASSHSTDFNLDKCSKDLKYDIYDVFLLMLLCSELGFIENPLMA